MRIHYSVLLLLGLLTASVMAQKSILCLVGLSRESWFLRQTSKGRRLVDHCGSPTAKWFLRVLLACGVLFGIALATGVVNPIRW